MFCTKKLYSNIKKKIKKIGCKLDNYDIISKIDKNIEFIYSKDEFFYVD